MSHDAGPGHQARVIRLTLEITHLGAVSEDHLARALVVDSLHHSRLESSLPQQPLALPLLAPEELELPALHALHVGDDHHPRVGDAVIVPVVHWGQGSRSAEVNLRHLIHLSSELSISYLWGIAETKVRQKRLSHEVLEHLQQLWTVLEISDER